MRLALVLTLVTGLAHAEEKKVTPEESAKAVAKLLADRCEAGETLKVVPPLGRNAWSGDWGRFAAVCVDAAGKQRGFDVYAYRAARSADDVVFENEGMSRAQLRRVLASTPKLRSALKVAVFAAKALAGTVTDGNDPHQPAEPPRREGDTLVFELLDGGVWTIDLAGEGPIEPRPR